MAKLCPGKWWLPHQQSQAFTPHTAAGQLSRSNSGWFIPKNIILPMTPPQRGFNWQSSVTGIWLYISVRDTTCLKSKALFYALKKFSAVFVLVMHWAWYATAASRFVQRYSIYTRCKQLLQWSLLLLQHTDTYTIWARFRGFSGWSGNIGCKGSRLEAQLKDLLSALVSFLAGDFWEEQGR